MKGSNHFSLESTSYQHENRITWFPYWRRENALSWIHQSTWHCCQTLRYHTENRRCVNMRGDKLGFWTTHNDTDRPPFWKRRHELQQKVAPNARGFFDAAETADAVPAKVPSLQVDGTFPSYPMKSVPSNLHCRTSQMSLQQATSRHLSMLIGATHDRPVSPVLFSVNVTECKHPNTTSGLHNMVKTEVQRQNPHCALERRLRLSSTQRDDGLPCSVALQPQHLSMMGEMLSASAAAKCTAIVVVEELRTFETSVTF